MTIPSVVAGEAIDPDWGNLVADSINRVGAHVARVANQPVSNNSASFITWDTETIDTDGFFTAPSDTLTVPTGMGGLYAVTATVGSSATWGGNTGDRFSFTMTGLSFALPLSASTANIQTGTVVVPLDATNTIKVSVTQLSGGAANFTGHLFVYRVGI